MVTTQKNICPSQSILLHSCTENHSPKPSPTNPVVWWTKNQISNLSPMMKPVLSSSELKVRPETSSLLPFKWILYSGKLKTISLSNQWTHRGSFPNWILEPSSLWSIYMQTNLNLGSETRRLISSSIPVGYLHLVIYALMLNWCFILLLQLELLLA